PLPDGDAELDAVILCRDAHLLAATPCNRTDIGNGEPLLCNQRIAGLVNLIGGFRNAETENPPGFMKPFRVLTQFEDLAAIGALTFEYSAGIMQAMGQHVNLCFRPFDEFAIHPDVAVKLVERNRCHIYLQRAAPAIRNAYRPFAARHGG